MLIRMCPLCDHEMKKSHYCDTCHSFIWKADMLDVHLNTESRGYSEESCAYTSNGVHQSINKKTLKSKNKANASNDARSSYSEFSNKQKGQKNPGKRKSSKIGALLVAVLIIIKIVSSLIEDIDMDFDEFELMLEDLFSDEIVIDYGDAEDVLPETAYEQYALTHDEVVEIGLPCTGYNHLNVDGSMIFNELHTYAINSGLVFENGNIIYDEYNEVYSDEYARNTYFEIHETFWDDDERIYLNVSYDTYNHDLHVLTMDGYNKELLIEYLHQVIVLFEAEGVDTGVWTDSTFEDIFNTGESGYKFTDIGAMTVYTSIDKYETGTHYIISLDAQ